MSYYPESVANGLIFNKDGEILLVRDSRWGNKLTLPGGHVEMGEELKDAVKREAEFKLGIDIDVEDMLSVQELIMHPDYYKRKHHLLFNFQCIANTEDISLKSKYISSYIWARLEDALVLDLEPYSKKAIKDLVSLKEYNAKKVIW